MSRDKINPAFQAIMFDKFKLRDESERTEVVPSTVVSIMGPISTSTQTADFVDYTNKRHFDEWVLTIILLACFYQIIVIYGRHFVIFSSFEYPVRVQEIIY